MKTYVFAVYDKAVNAYLQPFYARATAEAIRSFTELANDSATNVFKHPNDFTLYSLGLYDDGSGLFDCGTPTRVVSANEIVKDVTVPSVDSGIERAQLMRTARSP